MTEAATTIVTALITGTLSLIGVYLANRKSQTLIEYRLKQLEDKVDKHNNLIERTYILEGQVTEIQHDVRDLKGARSA